MSGVLHAAEPPVLFRDRVFVTHFTAGQSLNETVLSQHREDTTGCCNVGTQAACVLCGSGRPAWMSAWHDAQTTSVLRRRVAIISTQTGGLPRPFLRRSFIARMWCTCTLTIESQSSQALAGRRCTSSVRPLRIGGCLSIRVAVWSRASETPPSTSPAASCPARLPSPSGPCEARRPSESGSCTA